MTKVYIFIAALLIAFAVGFFLGRGKIRIEEKVEYVKGKTVVRPVKIPLPSSVYIPSLYFLPTKPDTLYIDEKPYPIATVDTAKIIQDYITQNTYEFNAFDDNTGKLDIKQTIQYNRLQDFQYTYTPIHQLTTRTVRNTFEPFGSVGYNTFDQVTVGGGIFINNLGLEYNYIHDTRMNQSGHGLSIKLKF